MLTVFTENKVLNYVVVITDIIHQWISSIIEVTQNNRFILHLTGKIRRLFLVHFRKRYVQNQLLIREGKCRQCGMCCNLLFTCPMLTKQGRCLIYGTCRPRACKVFPIDQRDIKEVELCGGKCGYRFNKSLSQKDNSIELEDKHGKRQHT